MKTKKQKILIGAAAAVLLAAGCAGYAYSYVSTQYEDTQPVRFYIPEGSDASAVGDTLRKKLGADFAGKSLNILKWRGGDAAAVRGSYVVEPGARAYSVASRLLTCRQTPVRVTFNNVRTMHDLAARVAGKLAFTEQEFLAAADTVLPKLGYTGKEQYPAAFIPDSYEFYWTAKPAKVIETLASEPEKFWNGERAAKAKVLGLTPIQVATLASIVEEESARADERPIIARLYLNRLHRGMKLQADPTVKFAIGDPTLRRITGKMLSVESPYNTYTHEGLPPGPIRIPERATMDAVLDAPLHDYLYMCAKADFSGRHAFATTYNEHQANAHAYHQALNERDIR